MNRKYTCIVLCLAIHIIAGACTSSDNGKEPHSTPVDSTNIHGTAPVDYDRPRKEDEEMLPREPVGGNRANTPGGDSIPSLGK